MLISAEKWIEQNDSDFRNLESPYRIPSEDIYDEIDDGNTRILFCSNESHCIVWNGEVIERTIKRFDTPSEMYQFIRKVQPIIQTIFVVRNYCHLTMEEERYVVVQYFDIEKYTMKELNLRDFYPFDSYLSKEELEVGVYFCKARNFNYGMWDGEKFSYVREKFNSSFVDREYHWDDGPPFGTVKPLKLIEKEN